MFGEIVAILSSFFAKCSKTKSPYNEIQEQVLAAEERINEKVAKLLDLKDEIIAKVIQSIDTNARCPQCHSIFASEQKYCSICGYAFTKPPRMSGRILDYYISYGGSDDGELAIEWQCLKCNERHEESLEFVDDMKPMIMTLECNSCECVACDIIIESNGYGPKISSPVDPGTLDVTSVRK